MWILHSLNGHYSRIAGTKVSLGFTTAREDGDDGETCRSFVFSSRQISQPVYQHLVLIGQNALLLRNQQCL